MRTRYRKRTKARIGSVLSIGVLLVCLAGSAAAAGNAGSIWGAEYFPNIPLVTQDGKTVRFFDDLIKGKVVMINFIYTSCPDTCPLETARLREVQELLGDRVGKDVFMYSITIDPEHDTPAVMKKYAERFDVASGWLFLTGKEADITLLRKKLGLYREGEGDLEEHNVSGIMGNQSTGRWMKLSPFENPYIIATQVGSWLSNYRVPGKREQSYANAPKLRTVSKGESLFRTRCAACHTISGDTMVHSEKRSLGPDLAGVGARRERSWLARWLSAPEKLIEEKDPVAMAMIAAYDNVVMPNFRLNDVEIRAVLDYIQEETLRLGVHMHSPGHHH